jgi:hypothetical protein
VVSAGAASSRRALLTGAAAVAGSALLSACGSASVPGPPVVPVRRPTPEQARQDTPILLQAIALERRTVAAYTAAVPLLRPAEKLWATAFLNEELEHVGEVITLLRLAGTKVPDPAGSYAIGHPHDAAGALRVLDQLEALQLEQWMRWIPRLSAGTMRAAAASIVANDAQHLAALRGALGRPPLASAFVAGPRPEAA